MSSRIKLLFAPTLSDALIKDAPVKAAGPSRPELDLIGDEMIAAPVRGSRNGFCAKARVELRDEAQETCPIRKGLALL